MLKRVLLVVLGGMLASSAWADTPVVRSEVTSETDTNATQHPIDLPATIESGDLILVLFTLDGGEVITWDDSTCGTFTEQVDCVNSMGLHIEAKVADGTEDNCQLDVGTVGGERSTSHAWAIQTWEGTLSGGLNVPSAASGTSLNPDPPAATDSFGTVDRKTIAIAAHDFPRSISTFPTSYDTNQIQNQTAHAGFGSAERDQTSAGSQNPGTYTLSGSDQWCAATASINGTVGGAVLPSQLPLLGVGD